MAIPSKVIKVVTEGPQGQQGPQGPIGPQGPSGSADGAWIDKGNIENDIYYGAGRVGIGNFQLVDLSAELEIRQEAEDYNTNDLFLIKALDPVTNDIETRFVVNAQGVTVLGAFIEAPAAVSGGLYYNANGSFYLGFE